MRDRRHHKHSPWRAFGELKDWAIEWTDDLPFGVWGHTIFAEKKVLIANGLDEAQRRCTAEHERLHVLRGPVDTAFQLHEELIVNRMAARRLMPSVRRVTHAIAAHGAQIEGAAHELWVDEDLLHVRLSSLLPQERHWFTEQMETIFI